MPPPTMNLAVLLQGANGFVLGVVVTVNAINSSALRHPMPLAFRLTGLEGFLKKGSIQGILEGFVRFAFYLESNIVRLQVVKELANEQGFLVEIHRAVG